MRARVKGEPGLPTLGGILQRARERTAMTQLEVSRACGISKAAVANLERGIHPNPQVMTVVRIAEAVGVEPWRVLRAAMRAQEAAEKATRAATPAARPAAMQAARRG